MNITKHTLIEELNSSVLKAYQQDINIFIQALLPLKERLDTFDKDIIEEDLKRYLQIISNINNDMKEFETLEYE